RFIENKRANHERYVSRLAAADLGIRFPADEHGVSTNCWSSCARLPVDPAPGIRRLQSRSIGVRPVWMPPPPLAIYARYPYVPRDDVSRQIWRHGIMLPSGPTLTAAQAERVVDELCECVR